MQKSVMIAVAARARFGSQNSLRRRIGFTLMELVAITFILAVFALTLRPSLRPANEFSLDRSAYEIAEAIRYARSEAIRTGDAYGVQIEDSVARVRPFRADLATSPPTAVFDVRHPLSKQIYEVNFRNGPSVAPLGISSAATHANPCAAPNEIVFHGHLPPRCGDPLSSLLTRATIVLSLDGAVRTVTLEGETGRTAVQ